MECIIELNWLSKHTKKVRSSQPAILVLNWIKQFFPVGIVKNGNGDFQNSPPFEGSACFYVKISENFEHFQYFKFETDFLENESFFKKLEYRFLVERTKIEKASFPYKNAISEANVKTNRMVSTKWTYHKERSFASNYFIFLKILFQFKNLL